MTDLRRQGRARYLRAIAGALALALVAPVALAQTSAQSETATGAGETAAGALPSAAAGSASAAPLPPGPVLLELYTSQGCVSCPPADALFTRLADEPGVIALALHVDYWDYLGWEDHFADPSFTARQKRYARAADAKMIYTPQMIIDGVARLQGAREAEIRETIAERAAVPARVALQIRRSAEGLSIAAEADPPLSHPALVHVVRYLPREEVQIERGENAGHSITYRNIVTSWTPVAEWGGQAPLLFETELRGEEPVVVVVQQQGPGPVLAVAQLD